MCKLRGMNKTIKNSFFIIDSECLDGIVTAWYGYMVTPSGIFDMDNAIENINPDMLSGLGAYVFIIRNDDGIDIYQDSNGAWGLYIYQTDSYFAVSNSILYLIEYLSDRVKLSLNKEYAVYLLTNSLSTMAYGETIVNEIRFAVPGSVLHIDIMRKSLTEENPATRDCSLPPDSVEGVNTLDHWYNKWTGILRGVMNNTPNIQMDLSGGMDSRLALTVALGSGYDLNDISIRSYLDKTHTHAEDYEIASHMAEELGFSINRTNLRIDDYVLDASQTYDKNYYTKLTVHKELFMIPRINITKLYRLTGDGGESVRYYCYKDRERYIRDEISQAGRFGLKDDSEMLRACESILNRSYDRIDVELNACENAISEPALNCDTISLFRRTYNRSHFGRNAVESCISNVYRLQPLLDPELHKVGICSEDCPDPNLLMALILTRYYPRLLEFEFQGGRSIDGDTLRFARMISDRYPYYRPDHTESAFVMPPLTRQPEYASTESAGKQAVLSPEELKKQMLDEFHSDHVKTVFNRNFDSRIYEYADEYVSTHPYFSMRECNAILGIVKVLDLIENGAA